MGRRKGGAASGSAVDSGVAAAHGLQRGVAIPRRDRGRSGRGRCCGCRRGRLTRGQPVAARARGPGGSGSQTVVDQAGIAGEI
jgi:hypothetical protein